MRASGLQPPPLGATTSEPFFGSAGTTCRMRKPPPVTRRRLMPCRRHVLIPQPSRRRISRCPLPVARTGLPPLSPGSSPASEKLPGSGRTPDGQKRREIFAPRRCRPGPARPMAAVRNPKSRVRYRWCVCASPATASPPDLHLEVRPASGIALGIAPGIDGTDAYCSGWAHRLADPLEAPEPRKRRGGSPAGLASATIPGGLAGASACSCAFGATPELSAPKPRSLWRCAFPRPRSEALPRQ